MEKYSQFRDRGSGISPFLPPPTSSTSTLSFSYHALLFLIRLPLLLFLSLAYFLVLQHLPLPHLLRKALLWSIMAIPGIWWIDLRIDAVPRGSLSTHASRLPNGGDVIASSFTSPLDALYLAAVFDPIFVLSWPGHRGVAISTLWGAMMRALASPELAPPAETKLVSLEQVKRQYPGRIITLFPECTTTNGRGTVPLSPSLLSAGKETKIFPVSLRYSPADVVSPIPGTHAKFLWKLLSRGTHCIRVRIAEATYNDARPGLQAGGKATGREDRYLENVMKTLNGGGSGQGQSNGVNGVNSEEVEDRPVEEEEQRVLDRVGEALARLGRGKRVGLGVREKVEFVKAWRG